MRQDFSPCTSWLICQPLENTVPCHVFCSYKYYNVRMNFNFIFMRRLNVYIFTDRKCTLAMLLGRDCLWITKCKARDSRWPQMLSRHYLIPSPWNRDSRSKHVPLHKSREQRKETRSSEWRCEHESGRPDRGKEKSLRCKHPQEAQAYNGAREQRPEERGCRTEGSDKHPRYQWENTSLVELKIRKQRDFLLQLLHALPRVRSKGKQTHWPGREFQSKCLNDMLLVAFFFRPLGGHSHALLATFCKQLVAVTFENLLWMWNPSSLI